MTIKQRLKKLEQTKNDPLDIELKLRLARAYQRTGRQPAPRQDTKGLGIVEILQRGRDNLRGRKMDS